jgi:hypothetical protein
MTAAQISGESLDISKAGTVTIEGKASCNVVYKQATTTTAPTVTVASSGC